VDPNGQPVAGAKVKVQRVRLAFPIQVVEGDFESKRAAWGVKALPWLILTDKGHVVRAEGFSPAEVDGLVAN
jgi:hypothetical protein